MSEGWFCKVGDKKVGPLSVQQLKTIVARGQLRAEHLVRRGDAGPWVPAGRVKGLFPEKPGGAAPQAAAAKPAQGKGGAPAARRVAQASAASPPAPASDLPPEFSLGSGGHKHHVAMNVDMLDIDAEPVMVSTRKTKGLVGLKKDEQQKLTMILLGVIGGGLLLALGLILWAASQGYFSSPRKDKEEAKKEEAKSDDAEAAKKAAKSDAKSSAQEDERWTKFPESLRLKKVEVKIVEPVQGAPPAGSQIDASEHDVLVLPVKMVLKLGVDEPVDYAGWGESDLKNVSLKDDNKTAYKLVDMVVEPEQHKVIARGKPVTAKLIFEPPSSRAKFLRLEFPASAVGEQGMLKFEVSCAKIGQSRGGGSKKAPAEGDEDSGIGKTKKKSKAAASGQDDEESPPPKKKTAKRKTPPAETDADDDTPQPKKKKAAKPADDDDGPKIDLPAWAKPAPSSKPKQAPDVAGER
jgi:hypothetical protein